MTNDENKRMKLCRLLLPFILFITFSSFGIRHSSFAAEVSAPFQLKASEFPPEGTSHPIAGELIAADHVNRTGALRPDRTDAKGRGNWDLPLNFTLLPYGSIRYRGAPAALRDIPIGTHLHGEFYVGDLPASKERRADDAKFNRALTLEDDFSFCLRTQ